MYTAFYRASQYVDVTLVASILFVALFVGVLLWVVVEKPQRFDRIARQPFDDDQEASDGQ